MGKPASGDTWFIKCINSAFEKIGHAICYAPWTCILLSFIVTGLLSLKIPLTEMENNISDFTPYEARSRQELKVYREFFSNRGEPKAIYAFIFAKDGGNLLKTSHFNETVQILDKISRDFYLRTSNGKKNFEQFCQGFCTLNEPVRHFYSGMLITDQYANESRHLDLGYPITTVLGTKLYMDPNLFGVKIAVKDDKGQEILVSTANNDHKGSLQNQLPNNIREVALIVLQFRAEIGTEVNAHDMKTYELRAGLSLLPFLVIGFLIMASFSCVTFSISGIVLKQMNIHKITLAVMACVCPFMACGATLGAMFWCGFRFGSILCVTPKFPIDDVNSEVRHRIVEMLVETGPSVSITTITNLLAFGIGALTPTPEIQLFSIGNAIAVVVDFIFQVLAFFRRYEVEKEIKGKVAIRDQVEKLPIKVPQDGKKGNRFVQYHNKTQKKVEHLRFRVLDLYCSFISNKFVSSVAELSPHKLFLEDSDLVKIFDARRRYITTYYSVCWVLVKEPGDITNASVSKRIHQLVADFENLPSSVGQYSTKFWLRDYEDFHKQGEELDVPEEFEEPPATAIEFSQNGRVPAVMSTKGSELKQFLEWPEFSFWKGFLQLEHNRMRCYSDLGVSIYEDDAKFLDLIETMVPISTQSAFFTFVSMFAVAVLFISHPPTLFVATLSILSTSVGVFGIMSMLGAELDPIMMSATVMSIGFSVDIPSHISYHYYQTGKESSCVRTRLEKTVAAVGFPIMQASISTTLCVLSLFFVKLHMSQIFAECMLLVVLIGMIHGLLIIPVIFNLISAFPSRSLYSLTRC
ncbi:unnamed protein product [Nippostrongylus brasiliensis]|uniref:SSD domain-containing protein n=1 Tax=Nippostrongylus brasiliensis TaxID=27835 RepID=A0A158QZU8_NIPBR|nr:unnamed protein product [Nippostrongylus brasiliensis]